MTLKIAIQPDHVVHANGKVQSYSEAWARRIQERGHDAVMVDVEGPDFYTKVRACDGFMWRPRPSRAERERAMPILQAIEHGLRLPVFPSHNTRWHFQDKVIQTEMFRALGIPHPETWIFQDERSALTFARATSYPKVLKLASGVQGRNVMLLKNRRHAESVLKTVFRRGLHRLPRQTDRAHHEVLRRLRRSVHALKGINPDLPESRDYFHHGYALVQEFIPENDYDTRIAVIKDRAFAFRRAVRDNDFRASGSGIVGQAQDSIDPRMLHIAFEINETLEPQTVAFDFLIDSSNQPLVLELSVTYASWVLNEAPAYWKEGKAASGERTITRIEHSPGSIETMIVDDYIDTLEASRLPVPRSVWTST